MKLVQVFCLLLSLTATIALPNPFARSDLASGDALEGWFSFQVDIEQEPALYSLASLFALITYISVEEGGIRRWT